MPRLIRGPQSHAAPSTYTLAQNQAFIPESVTATFVGTAAAAFLPTLSIYAQSGELLARCPASQVSAGDSAEVTFAPLLRAAQAAAAGTAMPFGLAPISGPKNVASGVTTNVGFDDGTLYTDSPAIFSLVDDGAGDFGLMISENGLYQAWWAMQMGDTGAAPVANPETIVVQGDDQSASSSALKTGLLLGSFFARGYTNPTSGRAAWDVCWSDAFVVDSGAGLVTPILMQATQATGSTLRVYGNVYVVQLSTNTFGL